MRCLATVSTAYVLCITMMLHFIYHNDKYWRDWQYSVLVKMKKNTLLNSTESKGLFNENFKWKYILIYRQSTLKKKQWYKDKTVNVQSDIH